jgi:hypothetical protein
VALSFLPWAIALCCAAAPTSQPGFGRDIEQAVRDLGDERFEVRERATELLFRAGPGAVAGALGEAAARGSPEARMRAETILGKFSRGVFPDTPVEIAALGEQYALAADDEQQRLNIVTDLAGRGPYGCVVLLKLAEREPVAELREMMARFVVSNARQAPSVASILLAGGDEVTAERLLEQTAADGGGAGGDDTAIRAYAALLLHEGKLEAKLRQLQAEVDRGGEVEAMRLGRTLAYFYRAAGDLERAAGAAEKALDLATAETLALERRDWKRLEVILARRSHSGEREALRQLGFLAAAQRLSGDEAACDRTLELVRDIALRDGTSGWPGATVLLLNERLEGAIDLLLKRGDFPYAFDLLTYVGRFEEALGLLERARAQRPAEAPWLAAMAARLQWRLGRRDAAMALLNEVEAGAKEAGGADSSRGFTIYVELVAAEREIGRAEPKIAERALRDAAVALEGAAASENTSRLFYALYPRRAAAAAAAPWWDIACAAAGAAGGSGSKGEALATMERLMNRRLSDEQWTALVETANDTAGHALDAIHRSRRFGLVIDTLEAAGQAELAEREFEKMAELFTWAKNLPREAYLYAAEWYGRHGGQWARAAELYAACADKYGAAPDLVWLRGYALAQAGERERGERLMRQAPQLPLADERRMALLADAMAAHGHDDDAIAVRRMALRLGKPRGWTYYDECRTLSDALVRRGGPSDIAEAADLCQLYALEGLDLNGTSVDDVHLPRMVHQLRARALCREGKVAEAMGELRAYLAIAPTDIDAALEEVPELKKLGRADAEAAARELFDLSYKRLEAGCAKYPESGFLHNEAAWLAVRCGYETEAALSHARRAVELLPRDTASLDTLAEVLCRRGDRAGAVALMKRCEELEPAEAQHRQRREAFEKGKVGD